MDIATFVAGLAGGIVSAAVIGRVLLGWWLRPFRDAMHRVETKVTPNGGTDDASVATLVVLLERSVRKLSKGQRRIVAGLNRLEERLDGLTRGE